MTAASHVAHYSCHSQRLITLNFCTDAACAAAMLLLPPPQASFSSSQLEAVSQQLEQAIQQREAAAAELASVAAAAAAAEGQLAAARQEMAGKEAQLKEAAEKVGNMGEIESNRRIRKEARAVHRGREVARRMRGMRGDVCLSECSAVRTGYVCAGFYAAST